MERYSDRHLGFREPDFTGVISHIVVLREESSTFGNAAHPDEAVYDWRVTRPELTTNPTIGAGGSANPTNLTVPPKASTPIVMKVLPKGTCVLHAEGSTAPERPIRLLADNDGMVQFYVQPDSESSETAAFQIDCQADNLVGSVCPEPAVELFADRGHARANSSECAAEAWRSGASGSLGNGCGQFAGRRVAEPRLSPSTRLLDGARCFPHMVKSGDQAVKTRRNTNST